MPPLRVLLPDGRETSCPPDKAAGTVFGRDTGCDVLLSDPRVSSRHLAIFAADPRGEAWFVSDLNSRHGVTVNGAKVAPGSVTPIVPGDWIGAGPVTLRVLDGVAAMGPGTHATLIDGPPSRAVAMGTVVLGVAELRHISRISAARTREDLFRELLECAQAITGYARAMVVRISGQPVLAVDVLASRGEGAKGRTPETISRSLLATAMKSGTAVYDESAGMGGMSIMQAQIHSACCIRIGDAAGADGLAVYLDSRASEAPPRAGAADVATALASVASACLGRLSAADLERRHSVLQEELRAARNVQERLQPAAAGTLLGDRLRFCALNLPGLVVAGDIVDVLELGPRRAAVAIGDVMGKGAAAGMLMAAVQARLQQGLMDGVELSRLLDQIDRDTCARCPGVLVSLWVGVIEVDEAGSAMMLRYLDAGHGMCVMRGSDGVVTTLNGGGRPMLGVGESGKLGSAECAMPPGASLVLFTDGLTEQVAPDGEMLGMDRVCQCVAECRDWSEQVRMAGDLLRSHSAGSLQRDDVTVLAIGR